MMSLYRDTRLLKVLGAVTVFVFFVGDARADTTFVIFEINLIIGYYPT